MRGHVLRKIKGVNMFIVISSPRKKRENDVAALPPFIYRPESFMDFPK